MNDDMDAYLIAMDTSIAPGPSDPSPATLPLPSHPEQPHTANHRTRLEMEEDEEETENTDAPPEKKVWQRILLLVYFSFALSASQIVLLFCNVSL